MHAGDFPGRSFVEFLAESRIDFNCGFRRFRQLIFQQRSRVKRIGVGAGDEELVGRFVVAFYGDGIVYKRDDIARKSERVGIRSDV